MYDARKAAVGLAAVLLAGCAATQAAQQPTAQSPTPSPAPTSAPTSAPAPAPARLPAPVAEPGDSGRKVRELQARLMQLDWLTPPTSGRYDQRTADALTGFQAKRGLRPTGVLDLRSWRRLRSMTREPTEAELFDKPGPALLGPDSSGPEVRELQARLRQIAWYFGDVTDHYGDETTEAVKGFQAKRGIVATGQVDQRTLDLLEGMTTEPTTDELRNIEPDPADGAPLDPRCRSGRVLCIDKGSDSLRWVVDGKVRLSLDVRFGGNGYVTREGTFSIYRKSRDHVSSLYDTSMPFAMFFSGGQAVHYSPDFAANGYNGASHGCVNVRDYDEIASLYEQVGIGTKVVIYRS